MLRWFSGKASLPGRSLGEREVDSLFTTGAVFFAGLSTLLLRWRPEGRCAAAWITSGMVSGASKTGSSALSMKRTAPYLRSRFDSRSIECTLWLIAGSFVLVSVALAHFVSPWWLLMNGFVGPNLLRSAFTDWCPMVWALEKAGWHHRNCTNIPH